MADDNDTPQDDVPPESGDDAAGLSQDDLDALMAAQNAGEQPEGTEGPPARATPSDASALSSDELDAVAKLAADASSDDPESSGLDSQELDALLGALGDDTPAVEDTDPDEALDGNGVDDPVTGDLDETISLDEDNVDSILAGLGDSPDASAPAQEEEVAPVEASPEPEPEYEPPAEDEAKPTEQEPEPEVPPEEEGDVSDDMIAALLSAAESGEEQTEVSSENLAAAATAPPSQEATASEAGPPPDPPSVEEEPRQTEPEGQESTDSAPDIPQRPKRAKVDAAAWLRALKPYAPRIAASLVAGLLGFSLTFGLLWLNRESRPDVAELGLFELMDLEEAYERAQAHMEDQLYAAVIQELEGPLEEAPESDLKADAEFLFLEARYHLLDAPLGSPLYADLHADLEEAVEQYPNHPRAPEALYWQARLYEQQELPFAAMDTYDELIAGYPQMRGMDGVLMDNAELALEVNRPLVAAERLQRMLLEYPNSPYAGESKLLLGDAYLQAGMVNDARTLYVRVAEQDPDPQARAEGMLRLGRMAYEVGDYQRAVEELQLFLERTTEFEGNDGVYLELARAQRQLGQLEEARANLSDIINFFPVSDITPLAYVELADIMDVLGERRDALRLAQQASIRFPDHPEVLRSKGILLGLTGNPYSAAETLVDAEAAGAFDPELLLTAARHYRTAGMDNQALDTYARLQRRYPDLPAANVGAIEASKLKYEQGEVREALQRLESLAVATANSAQYVDVLQAQADLYRDLGWADALAKVSRSIALEATDDEKLADAAIALLNVGEIQEARLIVDQVEPSRLRDETAYAMLNALGRELLPRSPQEGLDYLEQAYMGYPGERRPADELRLLNAYIAANQQNAARRVVMELAARVREQPIESIHLLEAAIAWGDDRYQRGDYRMAADAYAMALEAADNMSRMPTGAGRNPEWAKYQRANALLELRDYANGLALLDEVAESDAPWAAEARTKAEYARLEQRMQRGRTGLDG